MPKVKATKENSNTDKQSEKQSIIDKNKAKTEHLKPFQWKKGESGNPEGKKVGTKDYRTIYREAIIQIAEKNKTTPEQVEIDLAKAGILNAMKGRFLFYQDTQDRVHGKPHQTVEKKISGEIKTVFDLIEDADDDEFEQE